MAFFRLLVTPLGVGGANTIGHMRITTIATRKALTVAAIVTVVAAATCADCASSTSSTVTCARAADANY